MMKTVFQQIKLLLTLAVAAVTAVACSSDETIGSSGVKEGLPVAIEISVSVPDPVEAKMTRATNEVETQVEKLALVFYRKSYPNAGPVVIQLTSNELGSPTQQTETNYIYKVTLTDDQLKELTLSKGPNDEGLVSGDWYLYGIANYDKGFVDVTLDKIKSMTKAEMDAYCTGGSQDLDIVETAVLQSGKYGYDATSRQYKDGSLTLYPTSYNNTTNYVNHLADGNGHLLVLRRLIAKNIFKFENGKGVTFTPTSYELHNYSTSSLLMDDEDLWGSGNQYATPTSDATRKANNNSLHTKTNIPISDGTFTFYTQENLQHAKGKPDGGWKYEERDRHNHTAGETTRDFKYAPDEGTYVVVKGNYSGPGKKNADGSYSNNVTGEVAYTIHLGDFSQANNYDYSNFSVRRNARYTYKVTVNGVNSIITECTSEDESQPGAEGDIQAAANTSTSLTLDAHYEQVLLPLSVGTNGISTFNLSIKTPYTTAHYTSADDIAGDYEWVKFGKPKNTTSFNKYGEVKDKLIDIKTLLNELQHPSDNSDYYIYQGGTVYVAAYVDEYYYEDKALSTFVNADKREMTLSTATSYSGDGHSSYTESPIFSLKQRSIVCPFKIDGTLANPFGVETVEETDPAQLCKNAANGDNGLTGSDSNFGYSNYSGNFSSKKWSTYINEAYNGYINGKLGGDGGVSAIMTSQYNYAFYYCLMRNRDIDGDDKIDGNELRWYLPAHDQCLYLWFGNNSIPTEARFVVDTNSKVYLTSTEGNNRSWWADEGVSFGSYKVSYDEEKNLHVRAIRSLGNLTTETSDIATYDANTRTVTLIGLNDNCLRSTLMSGNYGAHQRGDAQDKLYRKIQIASSDLNGTFDKSALTQTSTTGSSYGDGSWRVPNEKELGLMLMFVRNELSEHTGARTTYTTGNPYIIRGTGSNSFITINNDKITEYTIRLVRDVSSTSSSAKAANDVSWQNEGAGVGAKHRKTSKSR